MAMGSGMLKALEKRRRGTPGWRKMKKKRKRRKKRRNNEIYTLL
jgi:hypothetical protein